MAPGPHGASVALPAAHAHRHQLALLHQVGDRRQHQSPVLDAVVVRDVGGGRHPGRSRRPPDELADGRRAVRVPAEQLGGHDVLRQRIPALEAVPPGDRHVPDPPEVLERVLDLVPLPPAAAPAGRVAADLGGAGRAAVPQLGAHPVQRARRGALPPERAALGPERIPAEAPEGPVLDGQERGLVRQILRVAPRPPDAGPSQERALQHRGVVCAQPREQRKVVRPGEHVHRVDLQHAHALHRRVQVPHSRRGGATAREALRRERDPPGLGRAQGVDGEGTAADPVTSASVATAADTARRSPYPRGRHGAGSGPTRP